MLTFTCIAPKKDSLLIWAGLWDLNHYHDKIWQKRLKELWMICTGQIRVGKNIKTNKTRDKKQKGFQQIAESL